MTAISFQEAAIRSEKSVSVLHDLTNLGYIKSIKNPLKEMMVDSDSLDTYLANQVKPVQEQQEMIIKKKEESRMSETVSVPNRKPVDKITRYGWKIKDNEGTFQKIDKNLLNVDSTYQRSAIGAKIREIASEWSWIS